jgi:hypothetical protein
MAFKIIGSPIDPVKVVNFPVPGTFPFGVKVSVSGNQFVPLLELNS